MGFLPSDVDSKRAIVCCAVVSMKLSKIEVKLEVGSWKSRS
jgi:hypothetical protein